MKQNSAVREEKYIQQSYPCRIYSLALNYIPELCCLQHRKQTRL